MKLKPYSHLMGEIYGPSWKYQSWGSAVKESFGTIFALAIIIAVVLILLTGMHTMALAYTHSLRIL